MRARSVVQSDRGTPAWIGELAELEHLRLFRTRLRRLPESLGDLRALARLGLGHTSTLEQLPESTGRLSRLRSIDVAYCGLVALPDSIGDLPLTELDLTHNRLVRIPASIGRMKLRTLKLGSNLLTELPDELERLDELTELDLSANPFTTLPGCIARLPRLEILRLDEIPALDLADACRKPQHARTLRHLSLHGSKHTALPDEIGLLAQLESLGLGCNELASLPSSIARLTGLRSLDVHENDDSLPERVHELLPHLRHAQALERPGGDPIDERYVDVDVDASGT